MFILVVLVYVSDFNSSARRLRRFLALHRCSGTSWRSCKEFFNSSILQFFNSSILITNTLSLGLTLSGTLMLMRWPLVACSTGFRS